MPTVEKVTGGTVYLRSLDRRFTTGDRETVSDEQAAHLCDERDDFERVNEGATDVESSEVEDDEDLPTDETDPESEWAVDVDEADADAESDTSADAESDGTDDAKEDNAVAEGPYRDRTAVEDGDCGYIDPEEMDEPCGRGAGWGRDADDGLCKTHAGELEE